MAVPTDSHYLWQAKKIPITNSTPKRLSPLTAGPTAVSYTHLTLPTTVPV